MSAILIQNASIFAPEPLNEKDILIVNDRIVAIDDNLQVPTFLSDCAVLDANNNFVVPGFIDAHQHIIGAGGASGFATQVPPVQFSDLIRAGITTVGGLLGTDSVTRKLISLLAKAKGFNEEGITCFIFSGAYPLPSPTILKDMRSDIALIKEVRGGKMAIADHRVSPVSTDKFLKTATEVRIGGMICGYPAMLMVHAGNSKEGLKVIFDALEQAPNLARHIVVTHVNRIDIAFKDGVKLTEAGGYMEVTSCITKVLGPAVTKPSTAIKKAYDHGVTDRILMSSDAHTSVPKRDENENVIGLIPARPGTLHTEFVDCITQEGLTLTQALRPITKNVADAFSLNQKGEIRTGADADILFLTKDYSVNTVIAKGVLMMKEGVLLKKGTFEE